MGFHYLLLVELVTSFHAMATHVQIIISWSEFGFASCSYLSFPRSSDWHTAVNVSSSCSKRKKPPAQPQCPTGLWRRHCPAPRVGWGVGLQGAGWVPVCWDICPSGRWATRKQQHDVWGASGWADSDGWLEDFSKTPQVLPCIHTAWLAAADGLATRNPFGCFWFSSLTFDQPHLPPCSSARIFIAADHP